MIKLLRATLFAVAFFASNQAHTQSLSDLNLLFDAVWSISLKHPDSKSAFLETIPKNLKIVTIDDKSDEKIPKDWINNAQHMVLSMSKYGKRDVIECTYVNEKGISLFQNIIKEHGSYPIEHIPVFLNTFLLGLSKEILSADLVHLQKCTGLFHLSSNDVDYNAWDNWFDALELKFKNIGMKVIRQSSTPKDHLAGTLAGVGEVCEGKSCIYAVVPDNRTISTLDKSVAAISITSFVRR